MILDAISVGNKNTVHNVFSESWKLSFFLGERHLVFDCCNAAGLVVIR